MLHTLLDSGIHLRMMDSCSLFKCMLGLGLCDSALPVPRLIMLSLSPSLGLSLAFGSHPVTR